MILEGIVTTKNLQGTVNIAPMGPIVDASFDSILLRPFKTSTTYANLKEHPFGVLHVTDDVLLLAKTAIGRLEQLPPLQPAETIDGSVISGACRWYEFEVANFDDETDRTQLDAKIVNKGRLRDFFGFNRAKHAILEMAVLATRLHILEPAEVKNEFDRLEIIVHKTAGSAEMEALSLLKDHVDQFSVKAACTE